MNMKIVKFFVFLTVCITSTFSMSTSVFAQDTSNRVLEQEAPAVLVASVNLYRAAIVSQNGSIFTLSFDLSNGTGIQPGVKYAVQLFKQQEDGSATFVDQKVYPETILLGENETIHKTIEYTAPEFLKGTYQLSIVSENKNGLPLALGGLGDVVLKGTGAYIEIMEDSCAVHVSGEPDDVTYYLLQGVDVAPEESLVLTCNATNHFNKTLTVEPAFEIHHRTALGDGVDTDASNISEISFKPKETKKISLTIPKPTLPQAYDAIMMIKENDTVVSNSVLTHFVVRGASATIQNIVFDKNNYLQGDVAHISFVWTPSADIFSDSRAVAGTDISGGVIAEVMIVDGNGDLCADPFSQTFLGESVKEIVDVSIVKDCVAPVGTATLRDGNGTVLDNVSYKLDPTSVVVPQESPTSDTNYPMLLAIVSLLVIAGVGVYWFITSKKTSTAIPPAVLFVVLCAGLAVVSFGINVEKVKADTWTLEGSRTDLRKKGDEKGPRSYLTYVVNPSSPSYVVNTAMPVSWQMYGLGCRNGFEGSIQVGVNAGPKVAFVSFAVNQGGGNNPHQSITRNFNGTNSSLIAPSVPGNHSFSISLYFKSKAGDDVTRFANKSIAFSVPVPVNGGWGYTPWGACSAMCGNGGVQTRAVNACDNPTRANGGAACSAPLPADLTRTCDPTPDVCAVSLVADPSSVVRHGEARLSWSSNAHHCTASDGRAGWAGTNKPPSGQNWPTGQIPSATTYTITCFGDVAESISSVPASASITIRPPQCSDVNNDNDSDGRQNQFDPGCWTNISVGSSTYDPNDDDEGGEPACINNKDDDKDGLVDEADPGCHTKAPNADYNPTNPTSYDPLSNKEDNCGNKICESSYGETFGTCPVDCPYGWVEN